MSTPSGRRRGRHPRDNGARLHRPTKPDGARRSPTEPDEAASRHTAGDGGVGARSGRNAPVRHVVACGGTVIDDRGPRRWIPRVSDVVTSPLLTAIVDEPVGRPSFKDLVALGKPRIAMMAAIVGGGTFLLATPTVDVASLLRGALGLVGVTLIVMGAGALNMLIERDVDTLMTRTKDRPLAARRMSPVVALVVGSLLCLGALPFLYCFGGGLTLGLGLFSLFLYAFVYTPMKRISPWSLVVGAVPGAMPALMGGTIATGRLEVAGLAMFAVVFLWQLPHFMAISMYRQSEYEAAGHKVYPTTLGRETTKALIVATTAPLCALGVFLWPLGVGGPMYALVACIIGIWFTLTAVSGYAAKITSRDDDDVWARKVFIGSLVWQTVLFGALAVDRVIAGLIAGGAA